MGGFKKIIENDLNTKFGQGVLDGLKAANPFGDGYEKGEANFSQVMGNMGWNPQSGLGKFAKGAVGFAGDVLLDPTTYLTLGAKPILQGTAKSAGKIGQAAIAGREILEKSLKDITENQAPDILKGLNMDSSNDVIDSLVNKVKRNSKYFPTESKGLNFMGKTLVSDNVLRNIGDNTVAPLYNKAADAIKGSKVNDLLTKKFHSKDALDAIKTARENPLQAFKDIAFKQSQNTAFNEMAKLQRQLTLNTEDLFEGIGDEKKK